MKRQSKKVNDRFERSHGKRKRMRKTHERLNLNLDSVSVQRVRACPIPSSSVQLQRVLISSNQTRHSRRVSIHRSPNSSEMTGTRGDSSLSRGSSSEVVRVREDGDGSSEQGRLKSLRCWRRSEHSEALEDPLAKHRLSFGERELRGF